MDLTFEILETPSGGMIDSEFGCIDVTRSVAQKPRIPSIQHLTEDKDKGEVTQLT